VKLRAPIQRRTVITPQRGSTEFADLRAADERSKERSR
jgi:hypothetical protein